MALNFLQDLLSQGSIAQPQMAPTDLAFQQGQAPSLQSRPRRSALDIIGGISDVVANVGGATPLYQSSLDAQNQRAQQVDLDAMKKQLTQQQIQSGAMGIENEQRSRMAQALGAIADHPDAATLWPQVAQQAGIPPQQATAIGQELARNPQAAGMLAKALGLQPQQQGSLPSSIQNYAMKQKILAEQGPEAAAEFDKYALPTMQITPYQQAQINLGGQRITSSERLTRAKLAAQERAAAQKEAAKADQGGADLTPTQRGVVTQKLNTLPLIRQQVNRVKELQDIMEREGTLARGGVGGLLPGAIAGGNAEKFDKALGALRKSILSLTRTPGVGSMSNYETALDEMALPSRWGSDAGRVEAIQGIDQLVNGLETGYREMVPAQTSRTQRPTLTPNTPRNGSKPAAPQRLKFNPATGRIE